MATRRKSSTTAAVAKKETSAIKVNSEHRIKELEAQVSELKKRLEDLRKAKSQTIVKKDKEYVTSGVPKLGQKQTSIAACSCKQDHNKMLQENRQYKEQEIESLKNHISQLKITHADEIEKVKREYQKDSKTQLELILLQEKYKEMQEQNEKLKTQIAEQLLCIEDLYEQLSKKEAGWCEKEEKLKIELKLSWGEKYQQWMVQTEQKIEELQAANNYLKTLLHRDRELTDGNNDS